jgi:hypothetical protein
MKWICDVRTGCLAVYKADKKVNCIGDRPDNTILYFNGFWDGNHWEIQSWKISVARAITAILNFGYDWPSAGKEA